MPRPSHTLSDLRLRLEDTRLELRALFGALDQLALLGHIPTELSYLFDLDADFAEALWVLKQPRGRFDLAAMTHDTLASLGRLPSARETLLSLLSSRERRALEEQMKRILAVLDRRQAYEDLH